MLLKLLVTLVVLATATFALSESESASATTFPDPLPLTGPFFFVHDPSLVQRESDGKYFLFTTHDKAGIITATNLEGPWTEVGSILPNNSTIQLPGRDDIWAPDVSFHHDQYYAYYAVSTFGSQNSAIGLATSRTMEPGTWVDHGLVFNSTTGDAFNAIDPNLSIDEKGKPVLSFGSFWDDIFQLSLTDNLTAVTSAPIGVSFNSTLPNPEEGAFIWKHDEFYYLFISSGLCCGFNASALPPPGNEYKVFVGRSHSARGPFLDKDGVDMRQTGGTLVLGSHGNVYAPGGQVIFTDRKTGKDVFVYHYVPAIDSPAPFDDEFSSLGLNGIDWSSGWPVLTEL
ncbi:glycoside hydrolase family 43 protein [Roridomyces roridus]|uniref:Arabinan endo-1,5-alpha-L-arabinosidase n=1 Tax=Roridomyces roridus TaxID=1738132 RepID=A0AAD7BBK1_9AGAR|nr:glycoside hydrolase family 43 protein [Roridomyces roridus]